MTPHEEAQLGLAWSELARAEGHRKRVPEAKEKPPLTVIQEKAMRFLKKPLTPAQLTRLLGGTDGGSVINTLKDRALICRDKGKWRVI